jgi:transposase
MRVIRMSKVHSYAVDEALQSPAELELDLSPSELAELRWTAGEGSPSMSRHARIILLRHEGRGLSEISRAVGVDRATVRRWVQRFRVHRLRGLVHASTGKARKRRFDEAVHDAIVRLAMEPPAEAGESFTHWSLRRLRAHVIRRGIVHDISVEGLRQILRSLPLPEESWRRSGEKTFTLSDDVRSGLESLAQTGTAEVKRRARIVLARARGLSESEIASALSVGRSCVRRWLRRFDRHGMLGLQTARRAAHPVVFTAEVRAAIARCGRTSPREFGVAADRWSLRALRSELIRHKIVRRISIQHLRRILGEAGVKLRPSETDDDVALSKSALG